MNDLPHAAGSDAEGEPGFVDGSSDAGSAEEVLRHLRQRAGDRYDVAGEIGRGGMGCVYSARDRDLRRRVAMKVLMAGDGDSALPPGDRLLRFVGEAQITGQLDHPGIVPVHELGIDAAGRPFFTMKLVRGRTLGEVFELARQGTEGWSLTRVLSVVLRVCEAMAFAHARGVIHRDLKPSNVMVGRFGETYVMDWGLAKAAGVAPPAVAPVSHTSVHTLRDDATPDTPLITADGRVMGTPSYMAPEQAEGRLMNIDARTDVYAVGALLYHMLAGHAPYVPPGAALSPRTVLARVLDGPPRPVFESNPSAPADLVAVCEKAMAREPKRRYQGMREVAEDLEAFLDRRPVRAQPPGVLHAIGLQFARHRAVATTFAGASLLLLGMGVWFLWSLGESRQRAQCLADFMTTKALLEEARDTLTPRVPAARDDTRRWLGRAGDVVMRGQRYEAALAAGRGVPPLAQAELVQFQGLLVELRAACDSAARDLATADELAAPQTSAVQAKWEEVFADLDKEPRWRDLARVPQVGLLPLTRNDAGFWRFLALGTGEPSPADRSQPLPETGVVLVLLPGGDVTVGGDEAKGNTEERSIKLAPFLLSSHEATQAQWQRIMASNPSRRRAGETMHGVQYDGRHPVESISWFEAARFATRIGMRLPTEEELEYAGRAGAQNLRWFDGQFPEDLEALENVLDQSTSEYTDPLPWNDGYPTHAPVGSFRPNSFGLSDIGGNVSEWTSSHLRLGCASPETQPGSVIA
ncbi:MAG: bifunctional serine/threonine-protein kinase/formylglycine-generating enzyme family protein [Planctomycetota bacterium]